MENVPKTFKELFDFYNREVKKYYSHVQSENELPTEMLFELNAALDHVSRPYAYEGETEEEACKKAYGHFKRACLDSFKIRLRDTLRKHKELSKVDVTLIDNGQFKHKMNQLISDIKRGGINARRVEGKMRSDYSDYRVPAFEAWMPVIDNCLKFEDEFYLSPKIEWAKRKGRRLNWKTLVVGTLIGVVLTSLIKPPLAVLWNLVVSTFNSLFGGGQLNPK